MARKRTPTAYQLKITLRGSKPPIWRRIVVAGNTRLDALHDIFQDVMGWTDGHLHHFMVKTEPLKPGSDAFAALIRGEGDFHWSTLRGERYYGNGEDLLDGAEDEAKHSLEEIAPKEKAKFTYEYDFGDSWEHEVLVEKILPLDPAVRLPLCLKGRRACPPEDCGGVWGYADLLDALADPKHERHEELADWIGGAFDPEAFDVAAVNAVLHADSPGLRPRWAT